MLMLILLSSKKISLESFKSKFESTDRKPVFLGGFPGEVAYRPRGVSAPQVENHGVSLSKNHKVLKLHG